MNQRGFVARLKKSVMALAFGMVFLAVPFFASGKPSGPSIQFADTIVNFGNAMAGDVVRHEFVFTNQGDATLEITGVYPSCGCTTINDFTQQVAPGQTGMVSLNFDSSRFNGPITETTTIVSNDKAVHNLILAFKGTVNKPVEMSPPIIILKPMIDGRVGETNSTRLKNNLPEPITLGNPVSDNPAFAAELKILVPEKEFELFVHTVPPIHGSMLQGTVSMHTSSKRIPIVTVSVLVMPQVPFVISPAYLTLPRGPLTTATNYTVTFRNNGQAALVVNEARIDLPGAVVTRKEPKPGYEFTFTVMFPAGFQLPRNREPSLTILTGNTNAASIQVPLRAEPPAPVSRSAPRPPRQ